MLVDSFGHVIEVPDSTQQPKIFTMGNLKKQVARVINAQNDEAILRTAGDGIRWAANYADISRKFIFGAEQTASIPLVAEDNTINLPTDFLGVRQVELLMTDANSMYPQELSAGQNPTAGVLPYEPWAEFQRWLPDTVGDQPWFWTARNTFADGYIYIRPRPSTVAVTNWTLRIHYNTSVGLPDSDTDVIAAPQDFTTVLVEGAKYYLLFERKRDDPTGYRQQYAIFEQMLARYAAHDLARHGRKHGAWKIGEPS